MNLTSNWGRLLVFLFTVISSCRCQSLANGCLLEDDRNSVYVSVFEDAPVGSTLTELPIRGQTFGPDANIQLRLIQGQEFVSLDQRTKKLMLQKELDRDQGLTRFEVLIECKSLLDDHIPQLNISTFVTVKDVNDNAPEFDKGEYSIILPEELPEGTPINLEFEATDADQEGPNSFIRYRIIGSDSGEEINEFSSSSKNPKQLLKIPDPYKPQIVTRAKLKVVVQDADDLNPVFQHESYYTNSIQDSIFEIFPDPIFAKDGDTLNDPIYYEISGEFSEFYSINNSGTVRLVKDTVISTTLFIHARQVNRPERTSMAVLRVTNQSSIEFQHLLYSVQLTSNSPKGMEVTQVKAISSTPNIKMRYSILEDDSNIAYIEELTGRIFLNSTPVKQKYSMRLLATDGKSRAWSKLELTVKKVNVFEPEFDQPEYLFDVRGIGMIGQVRAMDRDENDTISYRLLNLQGLFKIDQEGMLSNPGTLKIIPGNTYELVVMAEDSQKHKSFVNVLLRTPSSGWFGPTEAVFIVFFTIVAAFFIFLGMWMARKCKTSCLWPTSRRGSNKHWRANPVIVDSGVVITRSTSTDIDAYNSTNPNIQRLSGVSLSEEKDRETVAISYANAAASFAPPNSATHSVFNSHSASSLGIGTRQNTQNQCQTASSSPARIRTQLAPNSQASTASMTPAIYFT
ncbi:hypothetical protein FO519_004300 [Halicephalobus sp. NKZ332]|nr:hypothetical protein FO519_004300 [Halicephalobus sp. NKZ332]